MTRSMFPPPRHGRWALPALALWLLAGCATNPVSGRREFTLVSAGQEAKMGEEGYKAVLSEYGAYDDSLVQKYVRGVGMRLAKVSQLPDLDWHFTVIDDPAVNAFAMPGGYIYITRGILAHLNSEAQLAGVLGHEIGHVTHRHSAEQLTRQQVTGIGLGVASLLSPTVSRYGDLAQLARAARTGKTGLVTRHPEYVRRLDGLLFGADPRQGYFESDDFYHPGLGF